MVVRPRYRAHLITQPTLEAPLFIEMTCIIVDTAADPKPTSIREGTGLGWSIENG